MVAAKTSRFAEATGDSRVDVNYRAFCAAVRAEIDAPGSAARAPGTADFRARTAGSMPPTPAYARDKAAPPPQAPRFAPEVEGVLLELAGQLRARKGRLVDFFKDGDRLGTGELSSFKFRSALGRAGLDVDPAMFACLSEAFGSAKRCGETIDWRAFHDALNSFKELLPADAPPDSFGASFAAATGGGFAPPRVLAASSSSALVATTLDAARGGGRGRAGFGLETGQASEADEMEKLLDTITRTVTTRRISVKPYFQDLDRCNANQVTKYQMGSVVSQNVGLDLSVKERDLLFNAFRVTDAKGNPTDRFDYKKFVKRVDSFEKF